MQRLYFTIALIFSAYLLIGQPIRANSFDQMVEAAKLAESQANYAGALDWYEKAYDDLKEKSRNTRGNPIIKEFALKIAELNYRVRDYEKSAKTYNRILGNDAENMFNEHRFNYAKSLKALGQYEMALKEFQKYNSLTEDADGKKAAAFEVKGIDQINGMEPNLDVGIKTLNNKINSGNGEFSPRQNADDGSMYFGSFNTNKRIEMEESDDFHAKIFMASVNDKGEYTKATALGKNINREGFHSSNVAFSRDGRMMYFTRVQTEGTQINSSKIMASSKGDGNWGPTEEIGSVNGEWHSKHPAVGQLFGQEVLFFASDMPGGLGGMDIYYSNINSDGSYSSPVNLGEGINTTSDDLAPFYHDGTLYYSTDGLPTIGGFDIFFTVWDGVNWSSAENLGLGFNSSLDDLYFSMNNDGKSGYFVSNRPTDSKKRLKSKTCCDDIFQFSIKELVIDLLAIVVDDADSPLNGATIKLVNLTDSQSYPTDQKYNALGNEFQFPLDADFKYKAVITADGYYPDSVEFNTAGLIDNYTIKKKVSLKAEPKVKEVVEIVKINEPIRMNNIYYDFDDDKILRDAEKDLSDLYGLMIKYPDMVIELSSHTDSQGRGSYNEDLSQRRAESATNWLLQKGIAKNRIKPVGYGESVIINHCKNGVKCTDDEHRQNRRTEFKIIAGPQSIEIVKEVKKTITE